MDDLLDRFNQRRNTGIQHDDRDDHGTEVLNASVAKRMFLIRRLAGQLGTDDGDQRTAGIGDVVDGIQNDGDRMGQNTVRDNLE